jgi:FK506-binding protein 4/5
MSAADTVKDAVMGDAENVIQEPETKPEPASDPIDLDDEGEDASDSFGEQKEGEEKKITDDGGIVKKIIKKGEGWRKPSKGADVTVHYVGKLLDGTVFDSSRDRGEPFVFKLGVGEVIKGWDQGVESMLKGEVALLTCKPEYAYGKAGSPPKIPPDSTLQFEVELISWTEEKDITESKDGGIMKKTIKEGEGWETPKEESRVTVRLVGKLLDGTVFEPEKEVEFTIGEEQVIEGLEVAAESMKKGEKALVTIQPKYAFGEQGNAEKGVPANTPVQYDMELVSFIKEKESWDMNAQEKLDAALKRKDQGNDLFKDNKIKRAMNKYKKAVSLLDAEYGMNDDDKIKAKQVKLPLYLNLAACKLQTKEWKEVCENCKKALEIDSHSVKALLRRGKAYNELDEWELARKDLEAVLELDPSNADAKREMARLKKKIADQNAKDRKVFGGMFEKLSKIDEKENKTKSKKRARKKQGASSRTPPWVKQRSRPRDSVLSACLYFIYWCQFWLVLCLLLFRGSCKANYHISRQLMNHCNNSER